MCDDTQTIVDFSIAVVESWKEAVAVIDPVVQAGKPDDLLAITSRVYPSIETANFVLAVASDIRAEAQQIECPSAFTSRFDSAVRDMAIITEYFAKLPRFREQCEGADERLGFWATPEAQFAQKDIDDYESIRRAQGLPSVSRVKSKRSRQNT